MPLYLDRYAEAHRAPEGAVVDGFFEDTSVLLWRVETRRRPGPLFILAPTALHAILVASALDGDKARYDWASDALGAVILEGMIPQDRRGAAL